MTNTYGKLSYDKFRKHPWVITNLAAHATIRLRRMFPRISNYNKTNYAFADELDVALDLEWFCKRYPLETDAATKKILRSRLKQHRENEKACNALNQEEYEPSSPAEILPPNQMRHHQSHFVDTLNIVKRSIAVDDVGMGKTFSLLGTATIKGALPMIAVCEPHLQDQFKKRCDEFLSLNYFALEGSKPCKIPEGTDIVFAKYNQLNPWIKELINFSARSIAFDEVQNLRTGIKASKGAAAAVLANECQFVSGYTATLIYNYGIECWNIFDIIRPGLLGKLDEFQREWCDEDGKVVKDPDALGHYLQEQRAIIRHNKPTDSSRYPPAEIISVEPDIGQLKDSQTLAESLAMRVLTVTDFKEAGQLTREFDIQMRKMTGLSKARAAAATVKLLLDQGKPVILFGYHHDVYKILGQELETYNPVFYTGAQSVTQKRKAKLSFINGETNLLIMSIRSGVGLDGLQVRAPWIVFAELDWSKQVHLQNIGRGDREGNPNPEACGTIYVTTHYGSDPFMLNILGIKDLQASGITDPNLKSNGVAENQLSPGRFKELATDFLERQGIALPTDASDYLNISNIDLAKMF